MKFITVKEAAQKWGVTTRRVQDLCKQGRIPGAQRWERSWMLPELFLRLQCACAYQRSGDMARATYHMDRAIALALPDRLLGPLVEHRRQLGYLLDDRLNLVSPEALRQIKALEKQQHQGWVKLHNHVLQKNVSGTLSVREREVARLAAFGLSDAQIAEQLMLSKATVKSLISMAKNKTGAQKRAELAIYI